MTLRAKKLKLPTERQIINVNSLENEHRKKQRINQFKKIENEVKYYESELSRWQEILDSLDFDIPEQLKRLEKYR